MLEEKEIEDIEAIKEFTPSGWLYVFLFIYYSIWLLLGFGVISQLYTFGFDEFQNYGLFNWLFFPVYLIAAFYSLYAVIKTLRGDADCITALKWSLVIVFLHTVFDSSRGQITTTNIWVLTIVIFARPLFYLIFYLYLCFAKGIKRRYPKGKRRFAPSGWVWTGILISFLAIAVFADIKGNKISQYCKKVDISLLNLQKGEISDGYILFNSGREWQEWAQPADSLWIDERIETIPTLMSVDSTSIIYLASGQCLKPDARTHNQIIVASLGILRQNELKGDLKEVAFADTTVNGNKLMATSFELTNDSTKAHFTVINITDSISPKCSVFVRIDKEAYDSRWPINLAKGVRFDLRNDKKNNLGHLLGLSGIFANSKQSLSPLNSFIGVVKAARKSTAQLSQFIFLSFLQNISEGKDNEKGDDTKHGQTNRIGDSHNQPYAYMLPTLRKSRLPWFFVGIMHAKHREREIAEGKGQNIFQYF